MADRSKFILCPTDFCELGVGTITGSAVASADTPLSNLQTKFHYEKWRSDGLTSVFFEENLGATRSVYAVGLWYSNLRPTSKWRVRFATSQANLTNGSALYDTRVGGVDVLALLRSTYDATTYATDWPYGTHALLYAGGVSWTSLVSALWMRVDFDDATHPDGYFQAGRLFVLGAGFSPARGYALGSQPNAEIPLSDWSRPRGGGLNANQVAIPESADYNFTHMTAAERLAFRTLVRTRRTYKEVVALDLDATGSTEHNVMHAMVKEWDRPVKTGVANDGSYLYSAGVTLESVAPVA